MGLAGAHGLIARQDNNSRTYAFSSATFLEAESFQEGDTLESA